MGTSPNGQQRPPPNDMGWLIIAALSGIGSSYVRRLLAGVAFVGLLVLVIPLSVVVFIVTGAVFLAVMAVLGTPTGALATVLGLGWLGGTLALITWICVLAWRRLWFIRALAALHTTPLGEPLPPPIPVRRVLRADPGTLQTRVSAADARLAPPDDAETHDRSD